MTFEGLDAIIMPEGHPRLFPLGALTMTPGVQALIGPDFNPAEYIARHARGDFGEIDAHDKRQNKASIAEGGMIMSVYRTLGGTRFYVITDPGGEVTTVLLPSEY